jgi:CTP:phosphocholine cytidylyltransferase-like protein
MTHLTETQRIEILILVGYMHKTKFKYLLTQFLTCF